MKILRNHILSEFLNPFLSCVFGLLMLFIVGRGLIQMADFIFNKSVDVFLVLKLLLYSLPFMLIFIIPMSVLIATLIAFRKLSHDNELMAIRASGVGVAKLITPLFFLVFLLCLFSFILSDKIASASLYHYRQLLTRIAPHRRGLAPRRGRDYSTKPSDPVSFATRR